MKLPIVSPLLSAVGGTVGSVLEKSIPVLGTVKYAVMAVAIFGLCILLTMCASSVFADEKACVLTYQLEDGIEYYKVPVTKLDGHVQRIDVEVGKMTYLYCDETRVEDTDKVLMSCAVEDENGMAGMTTFVYAADLAPAIPPLPPYKRPKLEVNQTGARK